MVAEGGIVVIDGVVDAVLVSRLKRELARFANMHPPSVENAHKQQDSL